MLHVSSLFQSAAPPILSFNMGSFGFLTSFTADDASRAVAAVFEGANRLAGDA